MRKLQQPYIRIDRMMPRHPKVFGLTDKAFRTIIEIWCYCSEQHTDGTVEGKFARRAWRRAALLELEKAGLLEAHGDDWYAHDYTDWQQTAAEVATAMVVNGGTGARLAHARWHVKRGRHDPECEFCTAPP
jgi:hypothetical protein